MFTIEHIKYTEENKNSLWVFLMNRVLVPLDCFWYFKIYLRYLVKIRFWILVTLSALGIIKRVTKEDVFDYYLDDSDF